MNRFALRRPMWRDELDATMASPEGYRYPDLKDQITSCFVWHREPYRGYWALSEEKALGRVAQRLAGGLTARSVVRALDAGCGEGRLLGWIQGLAGIITAVDPDAERIAAARRRWNESGYNADVTFATVAVPDLTVGQFDVIICSHVIQHVETSTVPRILRTFADLAAPGGALLLSYCRSAVGDPHYSVDRIAGENVDSAPVSRDQFDEVLRDGSVGAGLPIAHYDPVVIGRLAAECGWVQSWSWNYHVLEDLGVLDEYVDRDELVNSVPLLERHLGRDIMTLFHRCTVSRDR